MYLLSSSPGNMTGIKKVECKEGREDKGEVVRKKKVLRLYSVKINIKKKRKLKTDL